MTTRIGWIAFESQLRRQRQVLALHEVNHVSLDRIAAQIGVSAAQARIDLREARLAMCRRLSRKTQPAA